MTFFDRFSIKKKIALVYFLLVALPLLGFMSFTFYTVADVIHNQTLSAAQKIFDGAYRSLNITFDRANLAIDILANDELLYRMTNHLPENYPLSEQLKDVSKLRTTFSHLEKSSELDKISLYTDKEYMYSGQSGNIIHLSHLESKPWFSGLNLQRNLRNQTWLSPHDFGHSETYFSKFRAIYSPLDLDKIQGFIRIDIKEERIKNILDSEELTENGALLLLQNGNIYKMAGIKDEWILSKENNPFFTALNSSDEWSTIEVKNTSCYAKKSSLPVDGWELVAVIPKKDITAVGFSLILKMVPVVIFLMMIAYIFAYLVSRNAIKRLSDLASVMKKVRKGDTKVSIQSGGNDEIGVLEGSFDKMMNRINELMAEKEAFGKEIKNLELKALQAQINPHFLYNSLDLINCTALQHDIPFIGKLVTSLAKFYKLSLSKGKEVIFLEDELKHAKLYVEIQNMRFEDRIKVSWEVDSSILSCKTIKIILQPILENAIIHGIFEKPEKTGTLKLKAFPSDDCVFITIEDDGVGMSDAVLKENFHRTLSSKGESKKGYGVKNINERLFLAYGEGYGLSCESIEGKGSKVTVKLPYLL